MRSPVRIVGAVALIALLGGATEATADARIEPLQVGRYSTPEMADVIVRAATVEPPPRPAEAPVATLTPEPVVVTARPVAPAPKVAPASVVTRKPAAAVKRSPTVTAVKPVITDDPVTGPYVYDPEQPNEGRPNGAGGWLPDSTP